MESFAYGCLVASAFASAFSLPAGRALLVVCLVAWGLAALRARRWPVWPRSVWLWLLFVLVAVPVTVWGVHPELGVPRLRKLIWFAGIPLAASLVTTPRRFARVLGAYALGAGALALVMLVGKPLEALRAVRAGEFQEYLPALIHVGSMTNAQRLMLGILAALGFAEMARREGRRTAGWWVLLGFQAAALVLMFKRGSWICAVGLAAVFLAARMRWRALVPLALIVLAVAALPPVQRRFAGLAAEFTTDRGGRMTMWSKVTPALIKAYPWGVGYRSLTNDMMHEIAPEIEPGRDHLHSNICQILVETGWLGLAIFLAWMAGALYDAGWLVWRVRRGASAVAPSLALALMLMLVGLLANGLVEYNFGDGEIVLAYGLVVGLAAGGRRIETVP